MCISIVWNEHMTPVIWSHNAWQLKEEVQLTPRHQPAAADQQNRQAAEGSLLLFSFDVVGMFFLAGYQLTLPDITLLKWSFKKNYIPSVEDI